MITLTSTTGASFALNCDLIERIDTGPRTTITTVDGHSHVVAESLGEVVEAVQRYRSTLVARSQAIAAGTPPTALRAVPHTGGGRHGS
jgi:flagellar protein FlbD